MPAFAAYLAAAVAILPIIMSVSLIITVPGHAATQGRSMGDLSRVELMGGCWVPQVSQPVGEPRSMPSSTFGGHVRSRSTRKFAVCKSMWSEPSPVSGRTCLRVSRRAARCPLYAVIVEAGSAVSSRDSRSNFTVSHQSSLSPLEDRASNLLAHQPGICVAFRLIGEHHAA